MDSNTKTEVAESVKGIKSELEVLKIGETLDSAYVPGIKSKKITYKANNLKYSLKDLVEHSQDLFIGKSFDLGDQNLNKLLRKKVIELLKKELKSIV